MNVETFECSETAAEPIEASEEALALIASLGLEGQKELTVKQGDRRDTRLPYREMTNEERFVYGVLCPNEVEMKRYKSSPIPLRVLQIAAHANELGVFSKLVVWDRESVTIKDPILIGYTKHKEYSWIETAYILARWGEELETFSTLLKRAVEMKREQCREKLETVTSKAKMLLDNIGSLSTAELIEHGPKWLPEFDKK